MFSAARIVSLLLSFLAVVALAKESSRCPKMEDVVRYYQRYHAPQICDITSALTATMEQEREMSFERLTQERNFQLVPDEKTVVCPMAVESLPSEHDVVGMKTAWMVENTASTSVVLSWVDSSTMKEFSAMNGSIFPAHADPNAILKPDQHAIVYGYESHVFHVRELKADGSVGNLLLQHKLGLIPVGAHARDLQCTTKRRALAATPKLEADDSFLSRLTTGSLSIQTKAKTLFAKAGLLATAAVGVPVGIMGKGLAYIFQGEVIEEIVDAEPLTADNSRAPEFQEVKETRPKEQIECNRVEVGFRNRSPCPLHAKWVNPQMNCAEHFRFHLGVEASVDNFVWDWKSQTKFESSFMGHQYIFRLAADPSQVVDTIRLQPTRIVDCPSRKVKGVRTLAGGRVATNVNAEVGLPEAGPSSQQDHKLAAQNTTLANYVEGSGERALTSATDASVNMNNMSQCSWLGEAWNVKDQHFFAGKFTRSKEASVVEQVHQDFKAFLKKLEGHPERIQDFLNYMRSQGVQYAEEDRLAVEDRRVERPRSPAHSAVSISS